jgi:enoyl-[acyl-carrier-protein] reductase (NADH)
MMDQGIVIHSLAYWRRESMTMALVPEMSQKNVQMGHENAKTAKYAMAKTLGKMLKC